jgi:hypothetical protein
MMNSPTTKTTAKEARNSIVVSFFFSGAVDSLLAGLLLVSVVVIFINVPG